MSPSTVGQKVPTLDIEPRESTTSIYSAFVQDEIPVVHDRLALTLGAKVDHNNYTGFEVQPSARLAWTVAPHHTIWGAVTRAVRTPSRLERDVKWALFVSDPPPTYLEIDGNKAFDSEGLRGYEAGYRALLNSRLYVDVSVFHNNYDRLEAFGTVSFAVDETPTPPHLTVHAPYVNGIEGNTDGVEVLVDGRPAKRWQLKGSYSYLGFALKNKAGNVDADAVAKYEGTSPRHGVMVQSRVDLPWRVEFDQTFRYVGALPYQGIEGYATLDLRVGWRFARSFELSLVGQNLLQPQHAEFEHDPGVVIGIRRSAYAKVTWSR